MQKRIVRNITSVLLLIAMVICFITGIIKWPFLLQNLGISYRQLPMTLITDIHDWFGVLLGILAVFHVIQYRKLIKRMFHIS